MIHDDGMQVVDAPMADDLAKALALAHRVAVLAETDPCDPLVVALRVALEVADARLAARRDQRMVGWEIHGGDSAWWTRWARRWMPHAELAALRALPGTAATAADDGADQRQSTAPGRTIDRCIE